MIEAIRHLVAEHGRLSVTADTLDINADLFASGLKSFAAVQLLMAIENRFDIEFPDSMMNKTSLSNIAAIKNAIESLAPTER
jgi:acyl carrier protein